MSWNGARYTWFGERKPDMLLIDPPSGWLYGFPKPYTRNEKEKTLAEWLNDNGYPISMCTESNLKHCRFIGRYEELIENKERLDVV